MLLKHLLQALIILWSGLVFAFSSETNVKFAKVVKTEFYDFYQAVGEVKASCSQDFYAKDTGTITYINPKLGRSVAGKEVLIEIDGSLNKAMHDKALTNFDSAQFTFAKDQKLFDKKLISEDSFKKAKLNYDSAKFELQKTKQQYNQTIITSPFEGLAGVIKYKTGDSVQNNDYLLSITKGDEKDITVNLPGKFINKLNFDTKVELSSENNEVIFGKITDISPHILNNTGNFIVKLKVNDQNLKHNSYAKVKFYINEHIGLIVSEAAVQRNEKGSFVFIESEGKAKQLYVTLGTRSDKGIEIVSGLSENQKVVIEGLTNLFDGAIIKSIE